MNQTVAAKLSYDKKWYRAKVISCLDDGKYAVHFIDFGDQEKLTPKNILELRTDFLSLRVQAMEVSLANIRPR